MSLTEIIKTRKSVRTFDGRKLTEEDRQALTEYAKTITNPYGIPVSFVFLDAENYGLSSPVIPGFSPGNFSQAFPRGLFPGFSPGDFSQAFPRGISPGSFFRSFSAVLVNRLVIGFVPDSSVDCQSITGPGVLSSCGQTPPV